MKRITAIASILFSATSFAGGWLETPMEGGPVNLVRLAFKDGSTFGAMTTYFLEHCMRMVIVSKQ